MRKIAEHIAGACRAGEPLVLVAVAESKDSTPRKAGTLMLVSADGLACGTIGGGALEAHGIACARRLLGGKAHRFENMFRYAAAAQHGPRLPASCCAVSSNVRRRIWR